MKRSRLYLFFLFAFAFSLFGINAHAQNGCVVKGKVMDDRTLEPLSHASIEVRAAADSSLVGGGISDNRGEFSITLKQHAGECLVTVNYLGYGTERMALRPDGAEHHLKVMMKEDALTLNEVVVNSLTQEEKVQRLAYNVSMIETSKLKNTTLDLANVIDRINGVKIRQNGGLGSETSVLLNGFSGRHVKIFIDGVPMEGMSSAFGLNNIPAGLARRVEVYKGVVPVELGGDALGGAINIVTDNRRRTRVNASYSFGSFNTHKSNLYAEWTSKKGFHISLNAYQNYSDNDYHVDAPIKNFETGSFNEAEKVRVRRFHDNYHNDRRNHKHGCNNRNHCDCRNDHRGNHCKQYRNDDYLRDRNYGCNDYNFRHNQHDYKHHCNNRNDQYFCDGNNTYYDS